MYLLDTDHLSVLERGGADSERLRRRLQTVSPDEVAATVISYEEQVTAYGHFQRHLQVYCAVPLIAFDPAAATMVQQLRERRIRIGAMDLKIASIALAQGASLLSRNAGDFRKVPGLRVEDWTV